MSELAFYNNLLTGMLWLAPIVFVALLFVTAPYGRHTRRTWGRRMDNRLGWIIMEAPAAIVFGICFLLGEYKTGATSLMFLVLWETHYIYRSFFFPRKLKGRQMIPVAIVVMSILFNSANAYLNGRYLFTFSGGYPAKWLFDLHFITGAGLFISGMVINRRADSTLLSLRAPQEEGYKIPKGGLFELVSCPNCGRFLYYVK